MNLDAEVQVEIQLGTA